MKNIFYCTSLQRNEDTNTPAMDIVRRVAKSLSGGLIIDFLDDASLVRIIRSFSDWKVGAEFVTLRKRMRLVERIEGVNLDELVSAGEMQLVFHEISDINKYPILQ